MSLVERHRECGTQMNSSAPAVLPDMYQKQLLRELDAMSNLTKRSLGKAYDRADAASALQEAVQVHAPLHLLCRCVTPSSCATLPILEGDRQLFTPALHELFWSASLAGHRVISLLSFAVLRSIPRPDIQIRIMQRVATNHVDMRANISAHARLQ